MPRISSLVLEGTIPTMVAVPPTANISNACSAVCFRPIASKLYSTPPFVNSFTAVTTSSVSDALRVSVAPITFAVSSFSALMSTAIMRLAPATRAP